MMKVNFAGVFRQLVYRHAEREALINIEHGRTYTFRELHVLSNRIANMMSGRLGLSAGDRYLLILQNDNLSLMHFWTILKNGAAAVFTNAGDSVDEHLRQVDFVRPKCVFVESERVQDYRAALRDRGIAIVAMDGVPDGMAEVHGFWDLLADADERDPQTVRETDCEPAFYRFTGGTTGVPKCAVYSYRHVEHMWHSFSHVEDALFTPSARFLHFAPLSHGTFLALVPTFFAGGCNLTQNRPDLGAWCEHVERFKVDSSFLVPTLLYRLLAMDDAARRDLSSLRTILYGAAPMSPAKLAELQARFGKVFAQIYGATESIGILTYLSKADHDKGADRLESCGRPVPGVELMIADDGGREVASGEIGELWHRHRGVIDGYLDNTQATASEFVDGWWKSGDLGRIDANGYCTIVDRKKDMIISGGFNIYATEVEAALSAHSAVLMCAAVGVPHAEWGEAVLAEVIRRPGREVAAEELIAHVKLAIGSYKAPKAIVFVDELPLSSAGKVLRRCVRDKYWRDATRQVG